MWSGHRTQFFIFFACESLPPRFLLWRTCAVSFFGGELSRVLLAIRSSRDENTMHPVVLDACSWV